MLLRPKVDPRQWAQENFGGCALGDRRRTQRLVKVAGQVAERPAASLPKIGGDWAGTRGIYRLLDCEQATLSSVTQHHRDTVRSRPGRFLILSDTTHVNFGRNRSIEGAGPVGKGKSTGFLLHSGLLIDPQSRTLVGLAGQVTHARASRKLGRQNAARRLKRWRESEMWLELFEQVGSPPEGAQYIHVCDSAADNFEVYATAVRLGCDFLCRAGRWTRKILTRTGERKPLSQAITEFPELGRYDLHLPQGNGRKARTARLRVRVGAIEIPLPHHRSPRVREFAQAVGPTIRASVIVVEETDPPPQVEPIQWVLVTSLPIETFEDAWEAISWYEDRWLIEEWHKALKTGCRLESRQLQSLDALLPLTGVLSVVAVLLVQLKHAARTEPHRPAAETVPALWLELLKAKRKIDTQAVTNYEFWRALAKLGGFLGRRHDGEPGWQTIWRGWQELHTLAEGAELALQHRKCG